MDGGADGDGGRGSRSETGCGSLKTGANNPSSRNLWRRSDASRSLVRSGKPGRASEEAVCVGSRARCAHRYARTDLRIEDASDSTGASRPIVWRELSWSYGCIVEE